MDNLEEMDKFLEKFNLPRLNLEEIDIMNNLITSTKTEAVIKKLPKNKSPAPGDFTGESFKNYRRANYYPSKTVSKNCRGRNTSKLIL